MTLTGLAFIGLTDPWVHGALMVVFVVLGVGAFVALAWAFSLGAMRWQAQGPAAVQEAEPREVPAAVAPRVVPAILIGRRMRRTRRRLSAL
jgi:hypothetical protein